MSTTNARLSLGFSCIGHTYSHLFGPIFYVAALSLENDLGLTHGGFYWVFTLLPSEKLHAAPGRRRIEEM